MDNILMIAVLLPILGAVAIGLLAENERGARYLALATSLATLVVIGWMVVDFDASGPVFQHQVVYDWIPAIGSNLAFAVDGIALVLIALTAFITPLIIVASWHVTDRVKGYLAAFLVLEGAVIGVFASGGNLSGPNGFAFGPDGDLYIAELSVAASHQRQGIGTRLIDAAAEHGRKAGYGFMTLTTYRDIPWNGPFYRRLGFVDVDVDYVGPELCDRLRHEVAAGHATRGSREPVERPDDKEAEQVGKSSDDRQQKRHDGERHVAQAGDLVERFCRWNLRDDDPVERWNNAHAPDHAVVGKARELDRLVLSRE